eukprot:1183719-Prorocentrum_minimum.AAC.5
MAGLTGEEAAVTWVVDMGPPETLVLTGPPTPQLHGSETKFRFACMENSCTFMYSVDGTGFVLSKEDHVTIEDLEEGVHTLQVKLRTPHPFAGKVAPRRKEEEVLFSSVSLLSLFEGKKRKEEEVFLPPDDVGDGAAHPAASVPPYGSPPFMYRSLPPETSSYTCPGKGSSGLLTYPREVKAGLWGRFTDPPLH